MTTGTICDECGTSYDTTIRQPCPKCADGVTIKPFEPRDFNAYGIEFECRQPNWPRAWCGRIKFGRQRVSLQVMQVEHGFEVQPFFGTQAIIPEAPIVSASRDEAIKSALAFVVVMLEAVASNLSKAFDA